MTKVLITGASGFLGNALAKKMPEASVLLSANYTDINLHYEDHIKRLLDLCQPDVMFHFVGMNNPRRNEEFPKLAHACNVEITKNICKNFHGHIIFPSTDKVFDGKELNPDEKSSIQPLGVYGDTKSNAEEEIICSNYKHHILRIPIVHGFGDLTSSSFVDQTMIRLAANEEVKVFTNVKRCFVILDELLTFFESLVDDTNYGIYHIGSRMMSYYERIRSFHKGRIMPIKGEGNPLEQNLNTDKLKDVFGVVFK